MNSGVWCTKKQKTEKERHRDGQIGHLIIMYASGGGGGGFKDKEKARTQAKFEDKSNRLN